MACPRCGYDNIDLHSVCRAKAERRAEKAQAALSAAEVARDAYASEVAELREERDGLRKLVGEISEAACAAPDLQPFQLVQLIGSIWAMAKEASQIRHSSDFKRKANLSDICSCVNPSPSRNFFRTAPFNSVHSRSDLGTRPPTG